MSFSCVFLFFFMWILATLVGYDQPGLLFRLVKCNIRVTKNKKRRQKTGDRFMSQDLGGYEQNEVDKFSVIEKENELGQIEEENELGQIEEENEQSQIEEENEQSQIEKENEIMRNNILREEVLSDISPHTVDMLFSQNGNIDNSSFDTVSNQYTFFETPNDRLVNQKDSLSTLGQQNLLQNKQNWNQMPDIAISCRETGCPQSYKMCVPFFYDSANFQGKRLLEIIHNSDELVKNGLKFANQNIIDDERKYILLYSCICKKYTPDGLCDQSVE
ncbi:hypothetical protein, conserved [Plasmodium gonderi]|uniref:Variable surface protein n=1 Tax=Plasmodium gonderi TaxID=77519 RepID=A0A1Y1JI69_PLAGO|nr:hypothetical protein, conserved [Plasmodium gonderi]GAW79794.1 hypothetical protein, conserved [Plasmodium gonderi]